VGFDGCAESMSNPQWIDKGTGATAKFRGVVMSPQGGPRVDDALSTIVEHRDAGLTPTSLDIPRHAKPADVSGMEHIMLEPIAPSIGTVIHGVDCAQLSEAEVDFIRDLWLEVRLSRTTFSACSSNQPAPLPLGLTHQLQLPSYCVVPYFLSGSVAQGRLLPRPEPPHGRGL
jgi:hypothetical protein